MVTNLICDACKFQPKCVGYNKLKPFTDEARTDLGIELEMQKCNDLEDITDNDEEEGKILLREIFIKKKKKNAQPSEAIFGGFVQKISQ